MSKALERKDLPSILQIVQNEMILLWTTLDRYNDSLMPWWPPISENCRTASIRAYLKSALICSVLAWHDISPVLKSLQLGLLGQTIFVRYRCCQLEEARAVVSTISKQHLELHKLWSFTSTTKHRSKMSSGHSLPPLGLSNFENRTGSFHRWQELFVASYSQGLKWKWKHSTHLYVKRRCDQ